MVKKKKAAPRRPTGTKVAPKRPVGSKAAPKRPRPPVIAVKVGGGVSVSASARRFAITSAASARTQINSIQAMLRKGAAAAARGRAQVAKVAPSTRSLAAPTKAASEGDAKGAAGPDNLLVLVYSPYCGHCINLRPEWDSAAATILKKGDTHVVEIDSSALQGSEGTELVKAVTEQGFRGVPHIVRVSVAADGKYTSKQFEGARTQTDLVGFAKEGVKK